MHQCDRCGADVDPAEIEERLGEQFTRWDYWHEYDDADMAEAVKHCQVLERNGDVRAITLGAEFPAFEFDEDAEPNHGIMSVS